MVLTQYLEADRVPQARGKAPPAPALRNPKFPEAQKRTGEAGRRKEGRGEVVAELAIDTTMGCPGLTLVCC